MSVVKTILDGDVAIIEIDNPPVNASSWAVRSGLVEALEGVEKDAAVRAVVIACAGKTFVAGADISEFGKPSREPILPEVMSRIENCSRPVVVAWHGTALGGGCEIGLAAHARIMAASGKVGLVETNLGIVPGAGGTQRLPRLVGVNAALGIIANARIIGAKEALSLGLIDAIAEGDVRADAVALARSLAGTSPRRTGALTVPAFDSQAFEAEEKAIARKARGRMAPVEAARLVRLAAGTSLADGLADERATFLRLMASEQSEALRYAFFAEREAAKHPHLDGIAPRPVKTVGVIGAGTMGAGIATALLDSGFTVTIIENNEAALEAGRKRIEGLYARYLSSGRVTEAVRAERLSRASFSVDLKALANADLVVEAVFEEMSVKQDLLGRLQDVVRPGCILATNTSYLDINAMSTVLREPENLIGLHFFSPANVMKLLEIVRTDKTAKDVLATGLAIGKAMGKISVVAGVCDGFIGNRILARYRQECEFMLEEGALPQDVDAAFEAYGFAMGPFAMSDLAGLDIAWARRKRLAPLRKPTDRYVPLADKLCEQGRYGQKTGAGWYRYEDGKRVLDEAVTQMVRAHAAASGQPQRNWTGEEIMDRVVAAMGDEGAKILEEGIAARASDIDVVLLNGYSFPAHRGGPMFQRARRAKA